MCHSYSSMRRPEVPVLWVKTTCCILVQEALLVVLTLQNFSMSPQHDMRSPLPLQMEVNVNASFVGGNKCQVHVRRRCVRVPCPVAFSTQH